MISKSISYKLVNKSTRLVEAEGNAKAMRKLRKQQPEQFEVYLSTNKPGESRVFFCPLLRLNLKPVQLFWLSAAADVAAAARHLLKKNSFFLSFPVDSVCNDCYI